MRLARNNITLLAAVMLVAFAGLAACAPAATPVPPTAVPTAEPAATPVPPTAAPTTAPATAAPPPAPKPVTLQVIKNDKFGSFLADGDGRTLYLFTKDTKNTSNCYDKCAAAWPALLPDGKPTLKDGVSADLIGSAQRKEGVSQLTYNGWPLYYYAPDKNPGDMNGQGVGNVWWLVSPEGNAIKPAALSLAKNDKLGSFLADDKGRTLYVFTKDTKVTSVCYDKCEQAWPPLLMLDKPTVGDGIKADLLGSTTRKDGTVQVTYNGMPLYYYAKDLAPGDTTGQGVGNVWFVVMPDGNPEK